MKINLLRNTKELPLHCHYSRELFAQPAYIEIDLESRDVTADYNAGTNSWSMRAFHGIERHYLIPENVRRHALERLQADDMFVQLCRRVLDGSRVTWDGNNFVGSLNDDAEQADNALDRLLRNYFDEDDLAATCTASEAFAENTLSDLITENEDINEAAKRLRAEMLREYNTHIIDDIADYLVSRLDV